MDLVGTQEKCQKEKPIDQDLSQLLRGLRLLPICNIELLICYSRKCPVCR